jgi:hypothetical protein
MEPEFFCQVKEFVAAARSSGRGFSPIRVVRSTTFAEGDAGEAREP